MERELKVIVIWVLRSQPEWDSHQRSRCGSSVSIDRTMTDKRGSLSLRLELGQQETVAMATLSVPAEMTPPQDQLKTETITRNPHS